MNGGVGLSTWAARPIELMNGPWHRFGRVVSVLRRHAEIPTGAQWLDVGCQMGQFLKVANANFKAVGYGIDDFGEADAVEVCRTYLNLTIRDKSQIFDGSWTYYQRRIDREGFGLDRKFDVISALEVIEHMVDTDAFLEQCRAHLHDDGWLVITTPNVNSLRNRLTVPLGSYPAGLEYRTVVHHVRLYNASTLRAHVESHGFRMVAMAGVSLMPHRLLRREPLRKLDARMSDAMPALCGNLVAVFRKSGQA